MSNYSSLEGVLYCKTHSEQLFKESGNFAAKISQSGNKQIFYDRQLYYYILFLGLITFICFMIFKQEESLQASWCVFYSLFIQDTFPMPKYSILVYLFVFNLLIWFTAQGPKQTFSFLLRDSRKMFIMQENCISIGKGI